MRLKNPWQFLQCLPVLLAIFGCNTSSPEKTTGHQGHPKPDISKLREVRSAGMRLTTALDTKVGPEEYRRLVTEMQAQVRLVDQSSLNSTEKKIYEFYSKSADEYTEAATLWNCRNDTVHTTFRTLSTPERFATLQDNNCVQIAQRHKIQVESPSWKPSLKVVRWPDALQTIWWDAELDFLDGDEILNPQNEAQRKDAEKLLDAPSQ
jgi:hypothetical protein